MTQASLLSYLSNPAKNSSSLFSSSATVPELPLITARSMQSEEGSRPPIECDDAVLSESTQEEPRAFSSKRTLQSTAETTPSQVVVTKVELLHLPALKRITPTLLPVKYPDAFYTEVIHDTIPADLSRVAVSNDKPVGWIRCRLEPGPDQPSGLNSNTHSNQIYIQALCLVAPHRGRGIASMLLEDVTRAEVVDRYDADNISAHVWENNEDALEWYEKRGFKRVLMIEGYYRKLRPGGAWLLRKDLR